MPFKHLITYTQSLLVHSIYHKYCPLSLHNSWMTNSMRKDARDLRNADDLYIPFARTDHIKKLPYFALPKVCNELTEQIFTPNPTTFKIAIKQHFLSLTNPTSSLPFWFQILGPVTPPHVFPTLFALLLIDCNYNPFSAASLSSQPQNEWIN